MSDNNLSKFFLVLIFIGLLFLFFSPKAKKKIHDWSQVLDQGILDQGVLTKDPQTNHLPLAKNDLPIDRTNPYPDSDHKNIPSTEMQLLLRPAPPSMRG